MNRLPNKDNISRHNSHGKHRSRHRGNRRNVNPLQRSYESNGPDVKIRGNAAQVAEKYMALARDALVSGDRILAENYMQHAEHYSRIIAAAQAASQPSPSQQPQQGNGQAAPEASSETVNENSSERSSQNLSSSNPSHADKLNGGGSGNYRSNVSETAQLALNVTQLESEKAVAGAPARSKSPDQGATAATHSDNQETKPPASFNPQSINKNSKPKLPKSDA